MVESCCIQQIFIELPEIAGIESSDFLKTEKAVNHKDQPLRIVIYPKTNIPLPTILLNIYLFIYSVLTGAKQDILFRIFAKIIFFTVASIMYLVSGAH